MSLRCYRAWFSLNRATDSPTGIGIGVGSRLGCLGCRGRCHGLRFNNICVRYWSSCDRIWGTCSRCNRLRCDNCRLRRRRYGSFGSGARNDRFWRNRSFRRRGYGGLSCRTRSNRSRSLSSCLRSRCRHFRCTCRRSRFRNSSRCRSLLPYTHVIDEHVRTISLVRIDVLRCIRIGCIARVGSKERSTNHLV